MNKLEENIESDTKLPLKPTLEEFSISNDDIILHEEFEVEEKKVTNILAPIIGIIFLTSIVSLICLFDYTFHDVIYTDNLWVLVYGLVGLLLTYLVVSKNRLIICFLYFRNHSAKIMEIENKIYKYRMALINYKAAITKEEEKNKKEKIRQKRMEKKNNPAWKLPKLALPKFHLSLVHKLVIVIVFLLLLFTNPSPSDFKTYLQAKDEGYYEKGIGRKFNFLLFSIYTNNETHKSYIGVIKNFF